MIARFLTASRCARILRLLDLERTVILNGPLASLRTLVDRRERVLAEILAAGRELPPEFVAALKARAERNARLLLASLAGVKAATAEVAKLERARGQIGAYTASGVRATTVPGPATRDLRA
jgi:hypothetical protein